MRESEKKSRQFAKQLRAKLTNAETILWSRLRRHPAHKFRRQHPIGPYIADFACIAVRLIIEVDGDTHATEEARRYDRRREAYLKRRGWRVLRVANCSVYKELTAVLDLIEAKIETG
jgi:very-short-patch-repair endonuclease